MKTFLVYVGGLDGVATSNNETINFTCNPGSLIVHADSKEQAELKAKNITFHNFNHRQSHEDLNDIMYNEFFHGFTVHGSIEI